MRHGLPSAAVAALGLIMTTSVWAVSVGDISPQSRVGEPLVVNIAIIDSDGIADDSIQVSPATAPDHALLGLQRPVWLDQMVFRTVRDSAGQLQVQASAGVLPTSSEQNFLVQVTWPGHVRLQQVSVLLPPANAVSAPAMTDPVDTMATSVIALPETIAEPISVTASAPPAAVLAPEPVVEAPGQRGSGPIRTRVGDTLSKIASEWDQDLTLNQRQQIIRERNPNAFMNGNINRLRADARIDLPDPESFTVPSERAANRWYSQALKQAQGFLDGDLKKPLVIGKTTEAAQAGAEPNVTLVAPGQGDASADGSDADAISSALSTAETERSSLLAKRLKLRQRLAELNATSAEADQRLQVLDERIAAMEAGETVAPDVKASDTDTADKAWMWWLAAGLFWLLLLILWLRQRAQRQQDMLEGERREPVIADSDHDSLLEPSLLAPAKPAEFDDSFAELAPSKALPIDDADRSVAEDDAADEEYDFLSDSDAEAYQTRLDLAQAYLDMNEDDAARQLLDRVLEGGTTEQRARAKALLDALG